METNGLLNMATSLGLTGLVVILFYRVTMRCLEIIGEDSN
jgi:hypothetical protein